MPPDTAQEVIQQSTKLASDDTALCRFIWSVQFYLTKSLYFHWHSIERAVFKVTSNSQKGRQMDMYAKWN